MMDSPVEKRISSTRQHFWAHARFAVIGDSGSGRKFPLWTYRGLKASGKTVYPIDPGAGEIDGDKAYADFAVLPEQIDAAVLELPREKTAEWIDKAADAGIVNLWIHDGTETPEALAVAARRGLRVETGACAVMYVTPGFTFHSIHKWIMQVTGKY